MPFPAAGEWLAHRRAVNIHTFTLSPLQENTPLAGAPKARLGERLDHSK